MSKSSLLRLRFGIIPVLLLSGCGGSNPTTVPPPTTMPPVTTPPTTMPPVTNLCTDPTPPPLYGIPIKVQVDNGFRKQLDSRPTVINVDGYCRAVGLNPGARFCDTRPEGHPQRAACDALVVGRADTGRFGPTWTRGSDPCFAPGDAGGQPGCVNHENNQFLVVARGDGEYFACAAPDVPLADGGGRCGQIVIAGGVVQ